MSFQMPLNFTRNRHRTTGVEGWRGDNKLDNSKYTLAANVYPKLNQDVTNNFKRTFGKSRPIKHIRKGRYNYENNKTYNNQRLIYEIDRPGGATVVKQSSEPEVCNGITSTLNLMTKTSAACCPQANALYIARRFDAGQATSANQYRYHPNYKNYYDGRNISFEQKGFNIAGKDEIGVNTYLTDNVIKKKGCGVIVYKKLNERFAVDGAATSGNYVQSLRNKPFIHPNKNTFDIEWKVNIVDRGLIKRLYGCLDPNCKIFTSNQVSSGGTSNVERSNSNSGGTENNAGNTGGGGY